MPRHVLPVLVFGVVLVALLLTWLALGRGGAPAELAITDQDLAPFRRVEVSGTADVVLQKGNGEHVSYNADPVTGFARSSTFTPFTPVANQTGQPAISLPVAQSANGLPVGAQFIAAPGREDLLLQVAGFVERSVDWSHRRAPTHG